MDSPRKTSRLVLAALAAAVALVWVGAGELPWPTRLAVVGLVVLLPALLLGQARVDEEEARAIPRSAIYISSIAAIWIMAVLCGAAALASGLGSDFLGLRPLEPARALAWTGAVTLLGLAVMASGRLLGLSESPLVTRLIPRTNAERALFVLVSLSAGIGEEFVFRGFLLPVLVHATGSAVFGVLISSAAFGLLHSYQHPHGVLRATLLGAVLALPVLVTGSLLPAIAAHALLDLIAGLLLADWLLGRPVDPA